MKSQWFTRFMMIAGLCSLVLAVPAGCDDGGSDGGGGSESATGAGSGAESGSGSETGSESGTGSGSESGSGSSGTSKGCVALCEVGQAGNCTDIKGDCGDFCEAVEATEDAAGCTAIRSQYESCLSKKPNACDANCETEESAFEKCFAAYCAKNISNPSCMTMLSSIQ